MLRLFLQSKTPARSFLAARLLLKDENKSKTALKKLGLSLLKGQINPTREDNKKPGTPPPHGGNNPENDSVSEGVFHATSVNKTAEPALPSLTPRTAKSTSPKASRKASKSSETASNEIQPPPKASRKASRPSKSATASKSTPASSRAPKGPKKDSSFPDNPINGQTAISASNESASTAFNPDVAEMRPQDPATRSERALPTSVFDSPPDDLLQHSYESVAYMSAEDISIQRGFDNKGPFSSFPSSHFIDRRAILRNLPDEIDAFSALNTDLNNIYGKLHALDSDRAVQLKYYRRYLKNYGDPVARLLQQFNRIDEKFKRLRRYEAEKLLLDPGAFFYNMNLCNVPYNVVGFDRSVSGMPLQLAKNRLNKSLPQEFIEDLVLQGPKIRLHKRDLNFKDETTHTVDPALLHRHRSDDLARHLETVREKMKLPRNLVVVPDVSRYRLVDIGLLYLANETEIRILALKRLLQDDIVDHMVNGGPREMMSRPLNLLNNHFLLCEDVVRSERFNLSLVFFKYAVKTFNLIPIYGLLLNTRRQVRYLHTHLVKIALLNVEDQVDRLCCIKHRTPPEMRRFMADVRSRVNTIVRDLLRIALEDRLGRNAAQDALIHNANEPSSFRRIYWTNPGLRRALLRPEGPAWHHEGVCGAHRALRVRNAPLVKVLQNRSV